MLMNAKANLLATDHATGEMPLHFSAKGEIKTKISDTVYTAHTKLSYLYDRLQSAKKKPCAWFSIPKLMLTNGVIERRELHSCWQACTVTPISKKHFWRSTMQTSIWGLCILLIFFVPVWSGYNMNTIETCLIFCAVPQVRWQRRTMLPWRADRTLSRFLLKQKHMGWVHAVNRSIIVSSSRMETCQ